MQKTIRAAICAGVMALSFGPFTALAEQAEPKEKPVALTPMEAAQLLVDKARATVVGLREKRRFAEVLGQAKAVLIAPELLKVGFLVGGQGGRGVLLARTGENTWSYPAFYRVTAGSVGLQFGLEVAEMGLVIMSDTALDRVLAGNIELGAGIDLTLATVGGSAAVDTEADIYTFSITKGAFAGVSFKGAVVSSDDRRNEVYYGQPVTALQITKQEAVSNPAADQLIAALATK